MDTGQLITFECIAREGNFSRAAHVLNLSQPTMTTRMHALEAEVGGALFIRGGRTITLTERGESFLPYVRRALEILAEGREVAQLTQEGKRGRVTIGAIESYSDTFLASTILQFHRGHPEVEVFLRTGDGIQIEQMLYDGVTRLGIINWPFLNPDLLPLLRLSEPVIFVAPPQHPLVRQEIVTAEDIHLQSQPLLIVQRSVAMVNILNRIHPHAERTMELPVQTACELLHQGVGVAFITRASVEKELRSREVVEIKIQDIPVSYRECVLVCLSRRPSLSSATRAFVEILGQQVDMRSTPVI